jgi:hypothetical protein
MGETLTLPAIQAVFSGKRLAGSVVGGAQILRDFPASSASPRPACSTSAR